MSLNNPQLQTKLENVRLLALDFDGIFTDGTVYVDQHGIETVQCSRRDGLGIDLLVRHEIGVHVISKEANPVVARRCEKLRIPYDQAVEDSEGKAGVLERIMKESGLGQEGIAFMGDDLNDVHALKFAGVAFTVADGHPVVKKYADYVTMVPGGKHAIREVAELILTAQGVQLDSF